MRPLGYSAAYIPLPCLSVYTWNSGNAYSRRRRLNLILFRNPHNRAALKRYLWCRVFQNGCNHGRLPVIWVFRFFFYRRAVAKYGMLQSLNRAGGRCHDNARCESMWARMKEELLYGRSFYDCLCKTVLLMYSDLLWKVLKWNLSISPFSPL